jgi:hypothetical protein
MQHVLEMRNAYKILVEKPKKKKHLEDIGIDGGTILKCLLQKLGIRIQTGFIWLRIGSSVGFV